MIKEIDWIHRNLTDTTTRSQSGPRINGNERVLNIP